ncbi:MAG: putative nucleotidyltransferase substrate binding domain-containing protein [Thiovulaceae bacterium]|nr:putative nucleotidyltransferase substrate binding domain-containing protein [Sulfurimonadaceae bacterium]
MSIFEQRKLIESIHPFGLLSPTILDDLMQKMDIAYYPRGTLLISKTLSSIAFYIIIKGSVSELIDDEVYNFYVSGDSFDADALIYGQTEGKFVVDEDLICYEIKKDDFLTLLENKDVQSYFLQDFISRHQQLKEYHNQSDLSPFLIAKISDIYLHNACIVDERTTIYDALLRQKELKASIILVKTPTTYAIVTDTNLKEGVLLGKISVEESIEKIASKNVVSIDYNDFLFNALLLMTQKSIKRVIVIDKGEVKGVLEQLDLLSYFANHSHLVMVQIEKAENLDELKNLQKELKNIIISLDAKGVKVRYITKLIATLNEKIYKKLFDICVDEELQKDCALLVMGSEGREEQSIKTDQDNALIIRDGVDIELFKEPMIRLNAYLLDLGFPPCPGNVMVSNPFWRQSESAYKEQISIWVESLSSDSLQSLSIFLDAKSLAGDKTLLDNLKNFLHSNFSSRTDVLAHMAKAALSFETPLSLFSRFILEKQHENKLDLKKGGIFALVHGIRTLSFEYRIDVTNTIERIKALNNQGTFDKTFATELIECFDTLSSIRLQAMLEAKNLDEMNYINPKKLQKIEIDLLKDSFKVVNKLKKFMTFHFHLNMVS